MNMRIYMKKKEEKSCFNAESIAFKAFRAFTLRKVKKSFLAVLFLIGAVFMLVGSQNNIDIVELQDEGLIKMSSSPIAATSSATKGTITIPAGTVKANPFLPYRNLDESLLPVGEVAQYALVEPPEMVDESSDAARVMDTIVSGILYDKYSPSAIINIEGNDYLVKKGDIVNNYKVLAIAQDSVTVKLGENTYKAGIGEILTEGTLNHNDVSNLNNKFGGAK